MKMARKTEVSRKTDNADEEDSDRYDVINRESTLTEDSSVALASGFVSEFSTDDGSSTETSLAETEAESDLSSFALQADTEEMLDSPDFLSALSFESKPSVVGGWFDIACGWMDRPNMCMGSGGHHISLLKESHSKAAKAMQRLKVNETLKRAAEKSLNSDGVRKTRQIPEKMAQEDIGKGAMAAMSALTAEAIQPSRGTPDRRSATEVRDRVLESKESSHGATSHLGGNERTQGVTQNMEKPNEEEIMEARMKEVSARATEILKKTLNSRPTTPVVGSPFTTVVQTTLIDTTRTKPTEESSHVMETQNVTLDSRPAKAGEVPDLVTEISKSTLDLTSKTMADEEKPSMLSHNELRKKVFDTLLNKKVAQSKPKSSFDASGPIPEHDSSIEILDSPAEEECGSDATPVAYNREKTDPDIIDPPPEDAPEIHGPLNSSHEVSEETEKISTLSQGLSIITDLTHIPDGTTEDEKRKKNEANEAIDDEHESNQKLDLHPSRHLLPPKRSSRSTTTQKLHGATKDPQVITLFELDDDDSWTPGERQGQAPADTQRIRHRPVAATRPDPIDSPKPFRSFFGGVRSQQDTPQEFRTSGDGNGGLSSVGGLDSDQRRQARASREEPFDDPRAREAFLGLRRGRIETRQRDADLQDYESKPRSTFQHGVLRTQNFDAPSPVNAYDSSFGMDPDPVIPHDHNRAHHPTAEQGLELRRRAMGGSSEHGWTPEMVDRRARHLVTTRSVDEAQRRRAERSRELYESDLILSRGRESEQKMTLGYHSPASREAPIDVHEYVAMQSREYEKEESSRQSFHQKYDRAYIEGRPSRESDRSGRAGPIGREHGMYNSVIINRSRSREIGARGHDMRDDTDSPYTAGRRDPSGHARFDNLSSSMLERSMSQTQDEDPHRMQEFRTYDRQISNQLILEEQEKHQASEMWDQPISVNELRQRMDEKRTAKLQRLRSRKTSVRHPTLEKIEDGVHYDHYGAEKSKYSQLRALVDSRQRPIGMTRRPNTYGV